MTRQVSRRHFVLLFSLWSLLAVKGRLVGVVAVNAVPFFELCWAFVLQPVPKALSGPLLFPCDFDHIRRYTPTSSVGRGAHRAQPARVFRPGLAPQSLGPMEKNSGRNDRRRGSPRRPAPQPPAVPPLPPPARHASGVGGPPEPGASVSRCGVRNGSLERGIAQVAAASAVARTGGLAVGIPGGGDCGG